MTIMTDLTPGQLENVKQEWRTSKDGFQDRVKSFLPDGVDVDALVAELTEEDRVCGRS